MKYHGVIHKKGGVKNVQEKRRKEKVNMGKPFINGKDAGKLAVSGRTFLGVPRSKVSSAPGSISKQDKRGEDKAILK